jgi:hypothetical protein
MAAWIRSPVIFRNDVAQMLGLGTKCLGRHPSQRRQEDPMPRQVLLSAHKGGTGLASATLGTERESFINLVLHNVVLPPFRIGTGQITDHMERLSGQVDIVVEYANTMSLQNGLNSTDDTP